MDIKLIEVSVDHPEFQLATQQYLEELVERLDGFVNTKPIVDPGRHFLALKNNETIGCMSLYTRSAISAIEIKRLWVKKSQRGKGVASVLLQEAENMARGWGFLRLVLDTNASLTEAIAIYLKKGFVEIPPYNQNPYAEKWYEKKLTLDC